MKKIVALILVVAICLSMVACTGGSSSGSSKTRTCKSCGRSFTVGDSAGNSMSIAKSGMCNNCYRNFKSMTGK